jgi:hypothetical protein
VSALTKSRRPSQRNIKFSPSGTLIIERSI